MELNHNVLEQIIKDLSKSIDLHRLIPVLYPNCTCNNSKDNKCFYCKSLEVIDDLSCLESHLKPIAKNTISHIQFIDVESFCYTLGKTGHVKSIEIQPEWGNPEPNPELNPELNPEQKPIGFTIYVTTSRYAMDGSGYHVGYETITYRWKAYSKRELGIAGIPYLLSSWVVNPNEFEIESRELPPEDVPEHESDCEFKGQDFSECDCADLFEGYWHPDDDFFYQEIHSILESTNWVEAEFDPDTREWKLGYTSFNVGEYQTNKDYADSCNEDDGMPSFGTYC